MLAVFCLNSLSSICTSGCVVNGSKEWIYSLCFRYGVFIEDVVLMREVRYSLNKTELVMLPALCDYRTSPLKLAICMRTFNGFLALP